MHSVMEGEDGAEPHDVFVDLGVLIVEGRIPGGAWAAGRGYGEGPHCAGVGISALPARHDCDPNTNFLCKRAENFRKHMQLLWQNNIPLCIEVLLCADCQCGQQKAQSPEVANIPSSTDLLLEQWIVTMVTKRCPEVRQIPVRSLFQAVRSQLHFSQLSAWWSCSKGCSPTHVNYRVTVPGEAFASQFQRQPVEHSFPVAVISRGTAVKVCMRTLPRMATVPRIQCPQHHCEAEQKPVIDAELLGAVGGSGCCKDEAFKWGEVTSKQPAADPLLGESLLDPPQSLDLFARRYQSPSRCGSPSLEAPEYLMFGRSVAPMRPEVGASRPVIGRWRDNSPPSPPLGSQHHRRLGRQGLARRRDASTFPASATGGSAASAWQKSHVLPGLVDDRMQNPCTRPGKHHCRCAFDEDLDILPPTGSGQQSGVHEPPLPCKTSSKPSTSPTSLPAPKREEPHLGSAQAKSSLPPDESKMGRLNLELSRREFEEVLSVLRDRNAPPNHTVGKKLAPRNRRGMSPRQDLVYSVPSCLPSTSNTAASDKADLLMGAILRSNKTSDASSSVLGKCDQGSRPCDKCEMIDERTIPSSLIWTARTESSKCATIKGPSPQSLSNGTSRECSDHVPLKLTSVGDRTKGEVSVCDDKIKSEVDERKNLDSPFLNKSLERIREFFKGDAKPTQENGESTSLPERPVPSAQDKAKFRRSLDSAASMVFHCRTGLPLTSSPAPVRRGTTCFDFDSTLNSVSAIRSALFESVPAAPADDVLSVSSDDTESESGARSPCSPGIGGPTLNPLEPSLWSQYTLAPCASLLGSFEESVLNGRLEPVSTVQGFTADLGASGSFCPRHLVLPVTVFFYTLGDNDKVSTPYLGHINLGKKGYNVPRSGTIQVTLLNPLGTVVKMFVVMYDLADMPGNSQTFLRQRTLYMPANPTGKQPDNAQKWLRYLIHLRFLSSKSGRIYLHSDIRMIIFRKSDMDTATAHGMDMAYELRSFTHGPTNPKFSPHK
ncbi:protein FAM214A isoform X2 [Zootermopsis nevadensis]|nr:protein FAM214A isoform X2 [Zootermopsis nevadensis]XP_021920333.1 protein FAM214A isoform X2 [Zootermopsis nevadensis]XP_021920334.1 protein FAM214A isoform X2 [Zootermopsis nevadensis]XP_021920335.1 protein FAM214A isoform X2 [Zootermopsis nevadensis]XP_021920337.1 protein FAM214A isoform X2 [Zootermopsis nevadensis]XP_021920338.1 protein FAM214A isoform X2 [Zootermopsis nevadensis]